MSDSSEDEIDENFAKHGENSGDSDGNFGKLDDETVPRLGADLNDLLEIMKKLHFFRLHHKLKLTVGSERSIVLPALTKSGRLRRKKLEGNVSSMKSQLVRLTLTICKFFAQK